MGFTLYMIINISTGELTKKTTIFWISFREKIITFVDHRHSKKCCSNFYQLPLQIILLFHLLSNFFRLTSTVLLPSIWLSSIHLALCRNNSSKSLLPLFNHSKSDPVPFNLSKSDPPASNSPPSDQLFPTFRSSNSSVHPTLIHPPLSIYPCWSNTSKYDPLLSLKTTKLHPPISRFHPTDST